ncbi:RNA 2',3'-cyclic phosphodiesterase [Rufibacter sp. LB8]|uniref:RNA 2',3'-cyclic phosphodiesterase n=1 Tax=Rufibacter sp. LB8 TaxID=2777781 RepID=UPI00178C7C60|nr:RNA 2',3'-cyclic phosphodiesterase [Rufibacter sp. LB8]
MQDTLRLFVAAALPQELKNYLIKARHAFDHPAVRPVPDDNLHLTLFFIGNVAAQQKPGILEKLADIAQRHVEFTLTLEQVEPGPSLQSPRLVWARFQQRSAFAQLSREVTQALTGAPARK